MIEEPSNFAERSFRAMADQGLQAALAGLPGGLVKQRAMAKARVPEFEAMRVVARDIRDHTLANLDAYLDLFAERAMAAGSHVHWARDGGEARAIILEICKAAGARLVTKGKSMVSEEIALNDHLEAAGIEVVETDLGEYIVQLRGERPSHIIAPSIHLTEPQVEAEFRRKHAHLPGDRRFADAADLVAEARAVLREKFLAADVGITGANFLVAETGSVVLVTNEGNGDLTAQLPRVHIALASIDKVVPTLEDTAALLRVLARSGTGQDITAYTSYLTGPRHPRDPDGPLVSHIVILDNGRSDLLSSEFRDVLRCIRCGACMNHCPVYNAIGGHAYGGVYAGPIGAVLTPAFTGIAAAHDLPSASTLCGRCEEVCPVKIPLPRLLRRWREAGFAAGATPISRKLALRAWAYVAKRPRLYRVLTRLAVAALSALGGSRGAFGYLPFGGGWTRTRDFPAPQGRTFQQLFTEQSRRVPR